MFNKQSSIYRKYKFHEYSLYFFHQLKPFILENEIQSHHDLACGSGEFVAKMSELGVDASGSDISPEMISLAKEKYPRPTFVVADMSNVLLNKRVDLITINYFAINILDDWKKWKNLFKNVYLSLNKNGYFIFDMAAIGFIGSANISSFRKIDDDYLVEEVKSLGKKCKFKLTWFQKEEDGKFVMNEEQYQEISFPFKQVQSELKLCGFQNVSFINQRLNKPDENVNGLHIIAQKTKD